MPDFKVTKEVVGQISGMFNVPEQKVKNFHLIWQSISGSMKKQYLAHVIRTMEDAIRDVPGNEMFRIICAPVDKDSRNIGIASSHYYKGRFFAIYYHPQTDEKQLRVMLAHELGHLFLVELANSHLGTDYNEKTQIEPASTILGIFTILDKNEFYHNSTAPFKHKTLDEVLADFQLLHNRKHGVINLSGDG